ncbi:MAG: adenylosuccinate synthetase [uncultured bacterium]|nr:MAG: adenylosuccinate synthetase [uncultured bacterium]
MGVGIRMKTGEYGATTGRPRRVGVMDLMRLKSAVQRSGLDGLFVTKVDCIGECFPFDNQLFNGKAPLVTGYSLGGVPIDYVPATAGELYEVAAQYTLVDTIGDISRARTWEELPPEAQQFVEFIQAFTACKVMGVGVGPSRDAMIYRG